MLPDVNTRKAQSALASYCRTGVAGEIPGVNKKHLHHYRRLVFNIIDDSLQSAFPLTKNLLTQVEWDGLVNEFFSNHPCQSPQVWTMPKELYEYMTEVKHPLLAAYPFLQELLWMEWLEIEIYMMEDQIVRCQTDNISGNSRLVINPEHRLIRLNYPVHLRQASLLKPDDKGNYYLVMHREPESGRIHFTDLSPFYARMIEHLTLNPVDIVYLIKVTAQDFRLFTDDMMFKHSIQFIENALNNKLILDFTN